MDAVPRGAWRRRGVRVWRAIGELARCCCVCRAATVVALQFVFKRSNEDQEHMKRCQAYSRVAKQAAVLFGFLAVVRAA
jgi:hypothetical protein